MTLYSLYAFGYHEPYCQFSYKKEPIGHIYPTDAPTDNQALLPDFSIYNYPPCYQTDNNSKHLRPAQLSAQI